MKSYHCWGGQENLIGPCPDRFKSFLLLLLSCGRALRYTQSPDVSFGYMFPEKEGSGFGLYWF